VVPSDLQARRVRGVFWTPQPSRKATDATPGGAAAPVITVHRAVAEHPGD